MKRTLLGLLIIFILMMIVSCDKQNNNRTVELRVLNMTGFRIDSTAITVNNEELDVNFGQLNDLETSNYLKYSLSFLEFLGVIFIDGVEYRKDARDFSCCLRGENRKYTIQIQLNSDQQELRYITTVVED